MYLFDKISELDNLYHRLNKVHSKMRVGHFFDADREVCSLMSVVQKAKEDLLKENEESKND